MNNDELAFNIFFLLRLLLLQFVNRNDHCKLNTLQIILSHMFAEKLRSHSDNVFSLDLLRYFFNVLPFSIMCVLQKKILYVPPYRRNREKNETLKEPEQALK